MSRLPAMLPDLPAELQHLLAQVPAGRVTTYGTLATALGDVVAARWVGEYLVDHPHDAQCPCHRVVRKDGALGRFASGAPRDKALLLMREGVSVCGSRVPVNELLFDSFASESPLRDLREAQNRLPRQISVARRSQQLHSIAGIDVSYINSRLGVAAYVLLDSRTLDLLWSTTVTAPVTFPYIPGYLTFRELPLFLQLFEDVRQHGQEADVTLVDGHGSLHPRRAGSASACGVAVGTPTVGIAKKLLCGQVDLQDLPVREPRAVRLDAEPRGMAIKAGKRHRPFFVSPGHRINLADATAVALQSLGSGRLPLPIALADRLSRETARLSRPAAPPLAPPAAPCDDVTDNGTASLAIDVQRGVQPIFEKGQRQRHL